jgi:predicted nucleotidyltransferase
MTGRRPVKINKNEWEVILFHKGWEGEFECQAFRNWWLRIRKKKGTNTFLVSAEQEFWLIIQTSNKPSVKYAEKSVYERRLSKNASTSYQQKKFDILAPRWC